MPDLESKIVAWREEMLSARISLETVAELEGHLRDDIAGQIKSGMAEAEALENSIRSLGCSTELQKEFKKIGSFRRLAARTRDTMLSLAGIPNHYGFMNEPSLNFPSRWGTYLRSALFLLPALVLWSLAAVYVLPKFKDIWDKAYVGNPNTASLANLLRFDLNVMQLFKDKIFWLVVLAAFTLGLLEWRSTKWPRYRRAVIGSGVFVANLVVLFSLALLFLGATFAAAQLAVHAAK